MHHFGTHPYIIQIRFSHSCNNCALSRCQHKRCSPHWGKRPLLVVVQQVQHPCICLVCKPFPRYNRHLSCIRPSHRSCFQYKLQCICLLYKPVPRRNLHFSSILPACRNHPPYRIACTCLLCIPFPRCNRYLLCIPPPCRTRPPYRIQLVSLDLRQGIHSHWRTPRRKGRRITSPHI